MTPETQSMLEKIQKLLNLANNKGATEGERDNAMRFAHKFLAKHNLTMAQVEQSGRKGEERIISHVTFYGRPWAQNAASSIARLFFCNYLVAVAARAADTRHYFIGKESNTITASNMAQFIVESIRLESKRHQRAVGGGSAVARSFAMGAAAMIARRVEEIRQNSAHQRPNVPGTNIVLASVYRTEAIANQELIDRTMEVRKSMIRGKAASDLDSYRMGIYYGEKIPLNRGIDQS